MNDFNLSNIFSPWHGWRKFCNVNGFECSRMKDFNIFQNTFAMVEENFGISMVAHNSEWRISIYFIKIFSPWLKKILEFQWSEWRISPYFEIFSPWLKKKLEFQWSQMLQNEGFQLISKYFHLGWRKFRNFNAAEWKISIYFIKIFSQWLKKNLESRWSQICPQNKGFQHISKYFHHG